MTEKLETTLLTFCKQIKGELICIRDKKNSAKRSLAKLSSKSSGNICVHPYLS